MQGLWELEWIIALQTCGALRETMLRLSWFGCEVFGYLLPAVYFLVSRRTGLRMYLLLAAADVALLLLKLLFHLPRPFWVEPRIQVWGDWAGYAFPSGHAVLATTMWLYCAWVARRGWGWAVAAVLILLVSFSRIYLGVHSLADVVSGWGVGALLVVGCQRSESLATRFSRWGMGVQLLALAWLGSALWLVGEGALSLAADPACRQAWGRYSAGADNPNALHGAVSKLVWVGCGAILSSRWLSSNLPKSTWIRLGGLAYTWAGLWLLRQSLGGLPAISTDWVRSSSWFLAGLAEHLWMLFLAPWILAEFGRRSGGGHCRPGCEAR